MPTFHASARIVGMSFAMLGGARPLADWSFEACRWGRRRRRAPTLDLWRSRQRIRSSGRSAPHAADEEVCDGCDTARARRPMVPVGTSVTWRAD